MKRTRIRNTSKKRASALRIYGRKRAAFLVAHPVCRRCQLARSAEVHHAKGRVGSLLLDERWWVALCSPCHRWLTEHPSEAYESGLSLRRVS